MIFESLVKAFADGIGCNRKRCAWPIALKFDFLSNLIPEVSPSTMFVIAMLMMRLNTFEFSILFQDT